MPNKEQMKGTANKTKGEVKDAVGKAVDNKRLQADGKADKAKGEFQKRAAFALLASLALHDRKSDDAKFEAELPRIRAAAGDDRNFVKKGVLWALRGIGTRSAPLHRQALALAQELAASEAPSARWIGREAARELKKRPPRKAR